MSVIEGRQKSEFAVAVKAFFGIFIRQISGDFGVKSIGDGDINDVSIQYDFVQF